MITVEKSNMKQLSAILVERQIQSIYGLMKDNKIERFYRDQRILQIGEGPSEILRVLVSRHLVL